MHQLYLLSRRRKTLEQLGTFAWNCASRDVTVKKIPTSRAISTIRAPWGPHTLPLSRRCLSFSFAGPRKLSDLLQTEKLTEESGGTIADLWRQYHADKEHALGIVMDGTRGTEVLERATKSPFFIQAVPRDAGHFVLVSQFQSPNHFLVAYLHDYQSNPSTATPWLTFTLFTDYSAKDVTLVRGDVVNHANLSQPDAMQIVESILYSYTDDYDNVAAMNHEPAQFDVNDTISRMNARWKSTTTGKVGSE